MEITGDCLTVEQVTELMKLEPCGEGNRKPVFLLRNCTVQSKRALKEGKFTSMELRTGGTVLKAISFAMPFAMIGAMAIVMIMAQILPADVAFLEWRG